MLKFPYKKNYTTLFGEKIVRLFLMHLKVEISYRITKTLVTSSQV